MSPFRPSSSTQLGVFSQHFSFYAPPHGVSHAVSYYCALFDLSCRSFCNSDPLFSTPCALFSKNPGWGYICHNSALSVSQRYHLLSIFYPFVFMELQIPLPASALYSHLYKTPGVAGVGTVRVNFSDLRHCPRPVCVALGLAIVNTREHDCVLSIGAE